MKQLRKLHLLSEKYHRIFGSVAEKLNAQMGLGRKKNGKPFVLCTTKLCLYRAAVIDQIEGCISSNLCKKGIGSMIGGVSGGNKSNSLRVFDFS